MSDRGHFQRVRSVVAGLARLGVRVVVHTDRRLRDDVRAAGGEFADLFGRCRVEDADRLSWPPVCRYVSFASAFADQLREDIGASAPDLVVHDTFAVAGQVAARLLGVPYVNVCAGHAVVPERFLAILSDHPRVSISTDCERAVDRLRARGGFDDISPFSYVTGLSPHLNLYCEPPAFLPDADRHVFEPVAFYGSLAADAPAPQDRPAEAALRWFGGRSGTALKVFASFGTAIWMSRTAEALSALGAIAAWAGRSRHVQALISLGGAAVPPDERRALEQPNVVVAPYVDQWDVLGCADVFVTHHGLNSTHEAIAHEVPMVSYPFVWDQPALAERCGQLGLAVPLTGAAMGAVTVADVDAAIQRVADARSGMAAAAAAAHQWERDVMADRPAVMERLVRLCA